MYSQEPEKSRYCAQVLILDPKNEIIYKTIHILIQIKPSEKHSKTRSTGF